MNIENETGGDIIRWPERYQTLYRALHYLTKTEQLRSKHIS